MSTSANEQSNSNIRIHGVRNNLNTIAMQTELAKMLVEANGDKSKIITALDKVLAACTDCSEKLQAVNRSKE